MLHPRHRLWLLSLLLLAIAAIPTRAQEGEWILLDSLENMQYWSLDCFDPMNCAVTGDSTGWNWFVRITDDGWKTSRIIILDSLRPPDHDPLIEFEHLAYPAADRLLLLAKDERQLWRSTDGGNSWDTIIFDVAPGRIQVLDMVNADTGFALGGSEWLFITTDGGLSWDRILFPDTLTRAIRDISAVSIDTIFVNVGAQQYNWLLATHDRGRTWTTYDAPSDIDDFHFVDGSYGWYVGGRPIVGQSAYDLIYRTIDGGATWQKQLDTFLNPSYGLKDIEAISRTHARVSGLWGKLYRTTNGGEQWIQEHNPLDTFTGPHIIDLEYLPSGEVYATAFLFRLLAFKQTSDVSEPRPLEQATFSRVVRRGERFGVSLDNGAHTIELYDLLGRRVLRRESEDGGELELTAPQRAGWYYLRVVGVGAGNDVDQGVVAVRVE